MSSLVFPFHVDLQKVCPSLYLLNISIFWVLYIEWYFTDDFYICSLIFTHDNIYYSQPCLNQTPLGSFCILQDFVSSLKDFTFNTNISSWVHLKKDVKLVVADVNRKKSKSHDKNSVVCHPSLILNIDYSVFRGNVCWIVMLTHGWWVESIGAWPAIGCRRLTRTSVKYLYLQAHVLAIQIYSIF
jgi:hypothetical protein